MRQIFALIFSFFTVGLHSFSVFSVEPQNSAQSLQKTYQNIENWKADFTQSTYVEVLGRNVNKKGEIFIQKPGKLRINYQEPNERQYISNGKKLWVYTPGDSQVEVYPKLSKIVGKEALSFLEGLGHIENEFVVSFPKETFVKNKNLKSLLLTPRRADSVMEKIILGIDPQTSLVQEMILFTTSGNRSHYVFSTMRVNEGINEALFEFKTPEGVREVKG